MNKGLTGLAVIVTLIGIASLGFVLWVFINLMIWLVTSYPYTMDDDAQMGAYGVACISIFLLGFGTFLARLGINYLRHRNEIL